VKQIIIIQSLNYTSSGGFGQVYGFLQLIGELRHGSRITDVIIFVAVYSQPTENSFTL
jgi:hypothetical protein